ncbi:MAG: hypothetical protein CMF60_07130 [Magnetococcales bacterium]|nr:hypothetical protein [Magnetococcales bacterium]|tara:strand:+ start:15303 stop:15848 length:546 start_codon:yes stop_codon:yes gene_type:complete
MPQRDKYEKLLDLTSQMSSDQQIEFIHKIITDIPLQTFFNERDAQTIAPVVDLIQETLTYNIEANLFEEMLGLMAFKCEDTHNKSKASVQTVTHQKKAKAASYITDAVYSSLEFIYHEQQEKSCPINIMHILNNIELGYKWLNESASKPHKFLETSAETALEILNCEKPLYVAEVVNFPNR